MAQKRRWQRDRTLWASIVGATLVTVYPLTTCAQIAGDGSLGTQVNGAAIAPCTGNCIITNGATRGSNLFHSLRQFSLPNGDFAGFITTPAIQNVIVRVTGVGQPFISNINGTIATSNPANFFLLNPNGILFGPGAALNIGGSFLATTANRMQFADGTEFRTDAPAPLLTISVPIGLQFGRTPGTIQARETRLAAGQTDAFGDFALVGGDVTLDDAVIQTPGRRIELSGVDENGTVGLRVNGDRLSLNLAADTPRRDITLTNGSFVRVEASNGGGDVVVTGHNIVLSGSGILAGILPGIDNAATNHAGDITINATNLQLTQTSAIFNSVLSNAIGQGGNIRMTASDIRVSGGSAISTGTSGRGNVGSVQVSANTITLDGTTPDGQFASGIFSLVRSRGRGRGGDITVKSDQLAITNGAVLTANTFGNGNAGDVRITAKTIVLDGTSSNSRSAGGIFSQSSSQLGGSSGNVTVETASLTVGNGAAVSASTFGNGNAGNVRVIAETIAVDGAAPNSQFSSAIASTVNRTGSGRGGSVTVETGLLTVTNGAVVTASTSGIGDAGSVRVIANAITLDGTAPNGRPSGIGSEVILQGRGRGGDVTIKTDSLSVSNRAVVSSTAFGNGSAGNLDITTRILRLDRGQINTRAFSGNGANINLNIGELLLMRNNSRISTSAGLAGAGGNGGNITINALKGFLVTAPNENNDITANAFNGSGGNVQIEAAGIYWFTPRNRAELAQRLGTNDPTQLDPRRLPTNDITAISQGNPDLSGTVAINILNLDPSRGLVALPVNLTDPSQQISQDCTPGSKTSASSFVATGRGGIPLSPDEPLESRAVVTKWIPLPEENEVDAGTRGRGEISQFKAQDSTFKTPAPIVESQGWIVRADGVVELVASMPTVDRANVWATAAMCQTSQGH